MNRMQVLQQINKLNDEFERADSERKTQIDSELLLLGDKLMVPRRIKRIDSIVRKRKVTKSELEYLSDCGFLRHWVVRVIKSGVKSGQDFINKYEEIEKNMNEAKRLINETDFSIEEIANLTGADRQAVYNRSRIVRGRAKEVTGGRIYNE